MWSKASHAPDDWKHIERSHRNYRFAVSASASFVVDDDDDDVAEWAAYQQGRARHRWIAV